MRTAIIHLGQDPAYRDSAVMHFIRAKAYYDIQEVRAIGKKGGGRSPNDQRSDALNPNSHEYQDAQDNRSVQLDVEPDKDNKDEEEE